MATTRVLPPLRPSFTITGKSVANKASFDSKTLINPTGTPIIASTSTFFSLIKSRRWNKAVGAPPKANTLGPSISAFVASVHAASVEEAARRPQVQALQRHGMLPFYQNHLITQPSQQIRLQQFFCSTEKILFYLKTGSSSKYLLLFYIWADS